MGGDGGGLFFAKLHFPCRKYPIVVYKNDKMSFFQKKTLLRLPITRDFFVPLHSLSLMPLSGIE